MRFFSVSRYRRLGSLTALAIFTVLLSACSPGGIVARTIGSNKNVSDYFSEQVVCGLAPPVSAGNCSGRVTGVFDGMQFYSLGQSGGTELDSDYEDCLQAPCGPGGASEIRGLGLWGNAQISFTIEAYDNGPGATDSIYLYSSTNSSIDRYFTCRGCVHVVVLPGHVPGT